jgi:uncharacterized membrane protein YbhN (UPF0104 family)
MKLPAAMRWLFSLAMLVGLLLWLDPAAIAAQIQGLDARWLAVALLVSLAQTALSAWRWRFTAARLNLELAPGRALADYYMAGFVNQVLPGGVLGDAWRAQRHARRCGRIGVAWRAVILERASGQLVIVALAALVVALHPPWREGFAPTLLTAGVAVLLFGLFAIVIWRGVRDRTGWLAETGPDVHRALLARQAWPVQLATSILIVLSYLLVFAAGARGIGVELPILKLMMMALPALLAMLIPVSVAGWGLREGAAGAVWLISGLPAEQGVAVSITYGVLVLIASLPGALVLLDPSSTQAQVDQ